MECIIVPGYWFIIEPKIHFPDKWYYYASEYYDHVSMLVILLLDFLFNSIVFVPR